MTDDFFRFFLRNYFHAIAIRALEFETKKARTTFAVWTFCY